MTAEMTTEVENFHWLLSQFVEGTAGVREAIAVSSDGFLLAGSAGPDRENVEQLAAVTAGLSSLTRGAAEMFRMQDVEQVIVEMTLGHLFISTISDGSCLAVLAAKNADIALVGYEMTLLVDRVGTALTPELIAELKNTLTV
jgi:predicted regulator of Ras-like GTPase activity (Roadblock/LC7/MglB family)